MPFLPVRKFMTDKVVIAEVQQYFDDADVDAYNAGIIAHRQPWFTRSNVKNER